MAQSYTAAILSFMVYKWNPIICYLSGQTCIFSIKPMPCKISNHTTISGRICIFTQANATIYIKFPAEGTECPPPEHFQAHRRPSALPCHMEHCYTLHIVSHPRSPLGPYGMGHCQLPRFHGLWNIRGRYCADSGIRGRHPRSGRPQILSLRCFSQRRITDRRRHRDIELGQRGNPNLHALEI
jgi:hypothetical protein